MESPLRPAEMVIGFLPIVLMLAVFVVLPLPDKPVYGFTDSGKRYRKVDQPTHIPLLATKTFWLVFALVAASAVGWAIFEALGSAVRSGTVSLPGTRGRPRPVVPWSAAWAYFLGLSLLLLAVALPWLTRTNSTARALTQIAAVLLGPPGYFLVLFAAVFSSWRSAVLAAFFFIGFAAYARRHFSKSSSATGGTHNDA
jgi:hypothetical protein